MKNSLKLYAKVFKAIGLLHKLQKTLLKQSLSAIYKYFVRPYLDYSDATFDQSYKASFHRKLETSQYNKALAITEAIIGTAKGKLFDEVIL